MQLIHSFGYGLADALVAKGDRLADEFGEFIGHGAEAHGRHTLALGPAEVGGEDHLGALIDHPLERGQCGADTGVIIDHHRAVLFGHRHVVVHAGKHAFTLHVQIVNGEFRHKTGRGE